MKKSLLSLTALVIGVGMIFGAAKALEISDIFSKNTPLVNTAYTQLLNDYDSKRGYTDKISLTCDIEGGTVTIVSPKIDDSVYETAPEYRLFLSPYRISQIKSGDPTVNNDNIIGMQQEIGDNESSVTFKLTSTDVKSDQSYYGFITPLDFYDEVGTPSKEICFHVNKNVCMLDTDCDTFDLVINPTPAVSEDTSLGEGTSGNDGTDANGNENENLEGDTHGAASDCVSMKFANVSHTVKGDKITLTWTAVDGETVDIAIFNPSDEVFEKVDTVKMSDEKYVYKMRWDGEQNFKLINDCGEVNYKADAAAKESEPEKIVTPATGPAENIMYVAIAAIILYGAYTVFFRKSDN